MSVQLTTPKVQVVNQVEVSIQAIAEIVTFDTQIVACEVTMPMKLSASDIMMPVDIEASYIALPVDIQGQYLDLAVSIVAQTIEKLRIDIVAQTLGELAIKAGDIAGNVDITIASCQKVGLFLQPEWAAKERNDKNFWNSSGLVHETETQVWLANIAPGTQLNINDLTVGVRHYSAVDHLLIYGQLYHCKTDDSGVVRLASCGGNGGFAVAFVKAKRVYDASNARKLMIWLRNPHPTSDYSAVEVSVGGYEV